MLYSIFTVQYITSGQQDLTVVCSTDRSKAVVPVIVLLFVALWFILRGDFLSENFPFFLVVTFSISLNRVFS